MLWVNKGRERRKKLIKTMDDCVAAVQTENNQVWLEI